MIVVEETTLLKTTGGWDVEMIVVDETTLLKTTGGGSLRIQ